MGNVRQLKIMGNVAFLTSRQCGLWSVDISDPSNPKILSHFDTAEMATGLDVADGYAFIGNRVFGVQCVDVSNPKKMKHVSSVVTQESQSVYYRDGIVYSGDWGAGEITAIDFSDPANPKIISKVKLDGYGDGIDVVGDFLYASTGQHKKSGPKELRHGAGHGLEIFDISDRKIPKIVAGGVPEIYFGPCDFWTPRVSGNYCFASDTVNGVFLVDISDKSNPKIIGNFILPKIAPDDSSLKLYTSRFSIQIYRRATLSRQSQSATAFCMLQETLRAFIWRNSRASQKFHQSLPSLRRSAAQNSARARLKVLRRLLRIRPIPCGRLQ